MTTRDCKHGHLARSCELCDYERLVDRVKDFVNAYRGDDKHYSLEEENAAFVDMAAEVGL